MNRRGFFGKALAGFAAAVGLRKALPVMSTPRLSISQRFVQHYSFDTDTPARRYDVLFGAAGLPGWRIAEGRRARDRWRSAYSAERLARRQARA